MNKDALALQLLLTIRTMPASHVTDIAQMLKHRLSDNPSSEDNAAWEQKIKRVCAYLKKLRFITYNGTHIQLTKKGREYFKLLCTPHLVETKGEK